MGKHFKTRLVGSKHVVISLDFSNSTLGHRQGVMEATEGLPKARNSLLSCLVAGGAAGTAVDVSLFPLDTLKTRLQSAEGFWKSGGFKRIYAGVGPAALGSAPNAALFFLTYEWTKDNLHRQINPRSGGSDQVPGLGVNEDPRVHMAAASRGWFQWRGCSLPCPGSCGNSQTEEASRCPKDGRGNRQANATLGRS